MPSTPDERNVPVETSDALTSFPCANCGANLEFRPGTSSLACGYCGFSNEIDGQSDGIEELDYHAQLAALERAEPVIEIAVVKCGVCAAEVERPPDAAAFPCVYCGADIVAQTAIRRVIAPRSLLPFRVSTEEARRAFRQWINKRWFAPNDLKRFARSDDPLQGMYVPYWTYDCGTTTEYTGHRGEHYWENQTYTTQENGKTVTKTKRVRKTRWYPAQGVVANVFDDVLVLGSRNLPVEHANELEPWDLAELKPYRDDYLAGFRAETYQIELDEGFEIAKTEMEPIIRRTIHSDIGGDDQQISSMSIRHHDITFKHLLLPVWVTAYLFRGKVYRILINARTGEVRGERPWSIWKPVLAAAAIVALVLIGVLIARFAGA